MSGAVYIDMDNVCNCTICLEEISILELNNDPSGKCIDLIKMICCENYIHEECLFQLFVAKHKNCPLCRSNMEIVKYFTQQNFYKIFKSFPYRYRNKNYIYINKLLYEISSIKYVFCGFKFKPMKITILYYLSNYKGTANLIYILCIYIFVILCFRNYDHNT